MSNRGLAAVAGLFAVTTTPDGDRALHALLGVERGTWADD